jgi:L-arabinose isomerase
MMHQTEAGSALSKRPTIGLISPYFGLFDAAMPEGFRADRQIYAHRVQRLVSEYGEVHFDKLADSDEAGLAIGETFAKAGVDVVVCAPSMAAPPTYSWAAIEQLPDVPIVVLGIQESGTVPADYTTEEATRRSLPVGIAMLTNVLLRKDRPFTTVFGSWDDGDLEGRLARAMLGAIGAGSVLGARMLAVGEPIDGYADIEATEDDLLRLGITKVNITPSDLSAAFHAVSDSAVAAEAADRRGQFDSSAVSDAVLERSVRVACALRELCATGAVVGGTVNCHSAHLRWNPEIGVTACLAVTTLTTEGRPFACTGDIPTAIALVLGRSTAGSALYCELYQLDLGGDWILVANGGEGDLDARDIGRPVRLLPEEHYSGDHGAGTAVAFSLPVGPATLISLSPVEHARGGWRLVAAEGEIVGSTHETMEGPNGMFRFSNGPVTDAFARWCGLGATHHAALLPGHHRDALGIACDYLGIESVEV